MILYNEVSLVFQIELKSNYIDLLLATQGLHRRNAVECVLITFKYHFIAGIFSIDPDFSMHDWDCFLEQVEITLNLLLPLRQNPKLSEYTQLNFIFNYNRTPMPSPGTITLVHDKLHDRVTWAPHGQEAWYICTSTIYYICLTS